MGDTENSIPFFDRDEESRHFRIGGVPHALIDNETIAELYVLLIRSIGKEMTRRFFYDSAKKAAFNLQKRMIETSDAITDDPDKIVERISMFPYYLSSYGYGTGETIKSDASSGKYVFRIEHSFISDELKTRGLEDPTCSFIAGIFAGLAEAWTGEEYSCRELHCASNGSPFCDFELFPGSLTDKFFGEIENIKDVLSKLDIAVESIHETMQTKNVRSKVK
ncbi:MAG: 4-vinyl reductase [Halobacteriota archaeon]|nr:4-vinyl reductase [Halobacteriota archaeon]